MKVWFKLIIVVLVMVPALCYIIIDAKCTSTVNHSDTIVVIKRDTIVITKPIVVHTEELGLRTFRIKLLGHIGDQVSDTDSIDIALPIEQKVYKDTMYTAWVSGYNTNLDSIKVYNTTRYITIKEQEKSRWSWGIQGGIGVTPKGIQPYIGIGIQYNFRL